MGGFVWASFEDELREQAPGVSSGGELRERCLRGQPPHPPNLSPTINRRLYQNRPQNRLPSRSAMDYARAH